MNENETEEVQVVETSIESIERAQVDVQISTAKKYPRVLSKVKQAMLSFATLDVETASSCFFTLPARKGGDGKPIQGPSVRMAEIALSTYGNIRAGARVVADDGKMLTIQGVCHDLESNTCVTVETRRRVTTKDGRRFSDDMVVMTGNAGCSIALRNAVFRVVPLALVKPIYEAAKKTAIGDAKTLAERRGKAIEHFTKMGVSKEKVFAVLGVKGMDDVGLEHLEILLGYANAIKEGDTSVDEVFNPKPEAPIGAGLGDALKAKAGEQSSGAADQAPAVDREELIGGMKEAVLDSKGALTEKKLFEFAKRSALVPEGIDDVWALPTAALVKVNEALAELAKGGR
ncbi:MAG: hypothetical protein ACOVQ6_18165 [Brevundimonas sp.]